MVIHVEETDVAASFSFKENGYLLEFIIPWAFMDINVQRDKVIPFNISAVVADPVVNATAKTCNLFNREGNFWDFRGVYGLDCFN